GAGGARKNTFRTASMPLLSEPAECDNSHVVSFSRRPQVMVVWTLAKKDLRLLLRDARAMIVLLAMPLIFILVLGVSLGEGFGKKAEDKLRVTVLILDDGLPRHFDLP